MYSQKRGLDRLQSVGNGQQCGRNEASDVRPLSDINAYIEGFMRQHRQNLQIRTSIGFHEQFLPRHIPAQTSFFITSTVYRTPRFNQGSGLRRCSTALRSPLTEAAAVLSGVRVMKKEQWLWVEKQGSVDVSLPTSDQKSVLQTCLRSANTSLSFLSRVKLQRKMRVLRNLYQKIASPLGFSTLHCKSFRRR